MEEWEITGDVLVLDADVTGSGSFSFSSSAVETDSEMTVTTDVAAAANSFQGMLICIPFLFSPLSLFLSPFFHFSLFFLNILHPASKLRSLQ